MAEIAKQIQEVDKIDEEKIESNGFITWRFNMSKFPTYNISTLCSNGFIMLRADSPDANGNWWTKQIPLPTNAGSNWRLILDGNYLSIRVPIET